jgi:hypothetical protein
VFAWTPAAVWLGALLALFMIRPNRGPYGARLDVPRLTHDLGSVTDVWARWDSIHFLQIAEHGYAGVKGNPAFYPSIRGSSADWDECSATISSSRASSSRSRRRWERSSCSTGSPARSSTRRAPGAHCSISRSSR